MKLAACAFVMTVPTLMLTQWLLSLLVEYNHSTIEILRDQNNLLTVLLTWTAAVILAPLAEEIFFRGFCSHGYNELDMTSTGFQRIHRSWEDFPESHRIRIPPQPKCKASTHSPLTIPILDGCRLFSLRPLSQPCIWVKAWPR